MKQIIRYRYLMIPGKMIGDLRITMEKNPEYRSTFDGGKSINLTLYPIIGLSILRPSIINEDGVRVKPVWNPNDSIGMTKFSLPIFIRELKAIERDMAIPDLYKYIEGRLDLDINKAELIKKIFMIGSVTVELSPVIIKDEDNMIEGIKIKFNNETSIVSLTLNELRSLIYNLDHLNIDGIMLQLYFNYCNTLKDFDINDANIIPPKRKNFN